MVLPLSIPRLSSKRGSPRQSLKRSKSSSSTLSEALRGNPFQPASRESVSVEDPKYGALEVNKDLVALVDLYPDVKIEVIREVLNRFDGDSRLEISAEQLYKYKAEWARGRFNIPPRDADEAIPIEELFRSTEYHNAVKKALCLEFRSLSKSAVDAVLAEVNSSYTHARPVLRGLAAKSWRATFSNLFKKKRKPEDDVPLCLFEGHKVHPTKPKLQPSGSAELDKELSDLYLTPLHSQVSRDIQSDFDLAHLLNQEEAKVAGALYECQCCYNDVTFESIASCGAEMHVVCFDCIRRTTQEALFGQGWSKSVDPQRATLRCLATSADGCDGVIPAAIVKRAVLAGKAGREAWSKYEERLANDALQKSQLKVVSCPFCSYAEADHIFDSTSAQRLKWRYRKINALGTLAASLVLLNFLPLILFFLIPLLLSTTKPLRDLFYTSIGTLALRRRPVRFRCRNPPCKRTSCLKCQKAWHDPHICHEPLLLSLRTTVEAARTTAVKRTCPRCGTSFVKSSGCNKLTCTCGYTMCYICRKNIGRADEEGNGGEGYRHFCEHFRPTPGQACTECSKCDLYRAEDEDAVVREAGEEAERLWRIKEGMVGVEGLDQAVEGVGGRRTRWEKFWRGNWTVQELMTWAVERVVVLDDE